MKHTFDRARVEQLLAHSLASPSHDKTYSGKGGPGLMLVGDHGVYLMSTGNPGLPQGENVVYADEVNPDTLPFDQWWAAKHEGFGGDDGVEYLDAAWLQAGLETPGPLVLEIDAAGVRFARPV